jgi:hypothetical protein
MKERAMQTTSRSLGKVKLLGWEFVVQQSELGGYPMAGPVPTEPNTGIQGRTAELNVADSVNLMSVIQSLTEEKHVAQEQVLKLRQALGKQEQLERRLSELTAEDELERNRHEELKLRSQEQTAQLCAQESKIEILEDHVNHLTQMLHEAHSQLLRRDQELHELLRDLQARWLPQAAIPALPPDGSARLQVVAPARRVTALEYSELIQRIRRVVRDTIPRGSRLIVVSRGDEELVRWEGIEGWHFPQTKDGVYAGSYPGTGAEAIAHLEALKAKGAEFILFPATALWWLDHYEDLRKHLNVRCRVVFRQEDIAVIYSLC